MIAYLILDGPDAMYWTVEGYEECIFPQPTKDEALYVAYTYQRMEDDERGY